MLFYGFDDLTPLQLDAIETLGRVVGAAVTVSLTYEPGRTRSPAARRRFARAARRSPPSTASCRRAPSYYAPAARAARSRHLERSLFEPAAARGSQAAGALRLLEGGGERAELELVAREIAELLGGGHGAARRSRVVLRAPDASAELLEEVFAAAGDPVRAAAPPAARRHGDRRAR